MSSGTGRPSSSSTVGATSRRCASSVPRAATPGPAAIRRPSCAWFASSGPVSFSRVWTPSVAADRPDRAPEQVAEDHDQVGGDAGDLRVDLLGLVDVRRERPALVVRDRGEPLGEVVAHRLVVGRRDDAVRLAALDVEEDARVVAALAPRGRPRPVDPGLARRRDAVRLGAGARGGPPGGATRSRGSRRRAASRRGRRRRARASRRPRARAAGRPARRRARSSRGSRARTGRRARACGARGPCTSRSRGGSGRCPSRRRRRAATASSRADGRRAGSACRSSRRPAAGGRPCRRCGSSCSRRGTRPTTSSTSPLSAGRVREPALRRRGEEAADQRALERPRRIRARDADHDRARRPRGRRGPRDVARLIALPSAMNAPSYVWSARFRKP